MRGPDLGKSRFAGVWRAPPPAPDVRKLPPWLLVAVDLFLILVAITALARIWAA